MTKQELLYRYIKRHYEPRWGRVQELHIVDSFRVRAYFADGKDVMFLWDGKEWRRWTRKRHDAVLDKLRSRC